MAGHYGVLYVVHGVAIHSVREGEHCAVWCLEQWVGPQGHGTQRAFIVTSSYQETWDSVTVLHYTVHYSTLQYTVLSTGEVVTVKYITLV